MKKFYATFKVKGFGRFPVDMLRYDRCFPTRETDSYKIVHAIENGGDTWEVGVSAFCETKTWKPTEGRWKSFCCSTSDLEVRKLY